MSALRKVRIWRNTPDGVVPEVVDAGPTPVAGLVIAWYPWAAKPSWKIVHEASGFGVAGAGDPEHALAITVALDGITDWTRPASEFQQNRAVNRAVIRAVEGARGHMRGPIATAEMVTAAEAGGAS